MRHLTATRVLIPGFIGPYDAHVNLATHWRFVRPLFTLDTVRQIAADTQAQADECGSDAVNTVHVIDGDPTRSGDPRAVVAIVRWHYWDQESGAKGVTDIAEPTEDGLYGVGDWSWEFQEWPCHCGEKNPWHTVLCEYCDRHRDEQAATPEGMIATRVCVDGPTTYPAYIDKADRHRRRVTPYFSLDAVRQLAADTQKAANGRDPRSAETIHVLETAPDDSGKRGTLVLHADWITELDDGPANAARTVVPNEQGLYPIGPDWHWSVAWWWCTRCEKDNAWHEDRCTCGLTRTEQPKTALAAATREAGRLLRALAPETTSALVDLTDLAHITTVYAGDTEIPTDGDGTPFDVETLGTADAELQRALDRAVIGDLTGAGWEPVDSCVYRITFPTPPAS